MAKKPNKSAVTRILQNAGQTKAVEYMPGMDNPYYRGPTQIRGFDIQNIANGELSISAPGASPIPGSANYEQRLQDAKERTSRLLHFYGETLRSKGYETAHRTVWQRGLTIQRMLVTNPDLVYGPPKPPELEQ